MIKLYTSDFTGWPSGEERVVMFIKLQPEAITKKYDLNNWIREEDTQLNCFFKAAHFIDESLHGPVVFMNYENQPQITQIYIDAALDINLSIKTVKRRRYITYYRF